MKRDVFLSYSREDDEPFVRKLYEDLMKSGFSLWWDRVDMPNRGHTFPQELRDAVESCDRLLAVIGPRALASDWVRAEWDHALLYCKGVVPVLRMGDMKQLAQLLPKSLAHSGSDSKRDARGPTKSA